MSNVILDAVTSGHLASFGTGALTVSHTCSGADRAMVLGVGTGAASNPFSAAPTYNGVDLVLLRAELGGASAATLLYYYPGQPPSGAHDLVLTGVNVYADAVFFLSSWNNVDTTALASAANAGGSNGYQASPRSDNITVPAGGVAVDLLNMASGAVAVVVGSGQTELAAQIGVTAQGDYRVGASYLLNATAMSWTYAGGAQRQTGHSVMALTPKAAADTVPPTIVSAVVSNGSPSVVTLTASEALDPSSVPPASAYTVGGHAVSSVGVSGNAINLTCATPFVYGEAARAVAYVQPGSSKIQDLAATPNAMASFSGQAITNNVASSGGGGGSSCTFTVPGGTAKNLNGGLHSTVACHASILAVAGLASVGSKTGLSYNSATGLTWSQANATGIAAGTEVIVLLQADANNNDIGIFRITPT